MICDLGIFPEQGFSASLSLYSQLHVTYSIFLLKEASLLSQPGLLEKEKQQEFHTTGPDPPQHKSGMR